MSFSNLRPIYTIGEEDHPIHDCDIPDWPAPIGWSGFSLSA